MKYSELINQIKYTVHPNKEKTYANIKRLCDGYSKKNYKAIVTAALCAVVLLIGIWTLVMTVPIVNNNDLPTELTDISEIAAVNATSYEGVYVSQKTSLKLTTGKAMSIKVLKECVNIVPACDYNITKNTANTFTISFAEPLTENTVYSVQSIKNGKTVYSWAFQTKEEFGISDYYPKEKTNNLSDSIQVDFTHSTVENFTENFSIYPAVSGTFEKYENRWKFIPSTEFETGVIYTVTIAGTVKNGEGNTLQNDFSFSFTAGETATSDTYVNYTSGTYIDTFFENAPTAEIISKDDCDIKNVDVYRIPSAEEFVLLHKTHIGDGFISSAIGDEIEKFDKVNSFTPNTTSSELLQYPDSFSSGYYISKINTENGVIYHLFQITDLSASVVTYGGDYTIWVNNKKAGTVQKDAEIYIDNINSVSTDDNGIAIIKDCKPSTKYNYVTVKTNNSSFVTRVCATEVVPSYSNEYISNIATDRTIYKAGDAVKLFGFIRKKDGTDTDICKIKLTSDIFAGYITVNLDKNGAFEHQFEIPQYVNTGLQDLLLSAGDTNIACKSIKIANSLETDYYVSILTDKKEYYAGEKVDYTINVTNKDGNPASDVEIVTPDGSAIKTDFYGNCNYFSEAVFQESPSIAKFDVLQKNGNIVSYYKEISVLTNEVSDSQVVTESVPPTGFILKTDKTEYKANDIATVKLYNVENELVTKGSIMLTFVDGDIIKSDLFDLSQSIEFICSDDFGETTEINALYYDGVDVSMLEPVKISIVRDKLEIKANFNKQRYNPGDEVTVNLETFEKGVISPLSDLCITFDDSLCESGNFTSGIAEISKFSSVVSTDKNGMATFTFTLPELKNDQSLSISGISKSGLQGHTEIPINIENGFYADVFIKDTATPESDVTVPFRFCTKFSSDALCQYSIMMLKNGKPLKAFSGEDKVNNILSQNFGKLDAGEYTLRLSAKHDGKSFAEDYSFNVKVQEQEHNIEITEQIEQQAEIDASAFNSDIALTVYDESLNFYNTVKKILTDSENPDVLTSLADHYLNNKPISDSELDDIQLLNHENITALASYSDLFKGFVDKAELKSTFENILHQSSDDISIINCYMGLATLNEPVLDELINYYGIIDSLDAETRTYLASAFACAGDYNTANTIYNEWLSNKIKIENGVAYYTGGATTDETMYMTSIISRLASKISRSDAKELVKALITSESYTNKYGYEITAFLTNCHPCLTKNNKIEVIYPDGNKEKYSYDRNTFLKITIPKLQKGTVKIFAKHGNNYCSYSGNSSYDFKQNQ